MKKWVRCIKRCSTIDDESLKSGFPDCEVGGKYFIYEDYWGFYVILEKGNFASFDKHNFVDLEVWRELQILKLDI